MNLPSQSNPLPKTYLRSSKPHIAYQVDYAAVNCGRIVAASKRHVRFKFGFTNMEALNNGKTGQECRGSEHEVSVMWSLSSGKQAVAFDQHEIFFDVGNSTQSKLSHSWKDPQGHSLEVKLHAANMSAKSKPDPDWQQYDLLINGVSFIHMPKIFEIGVFPQLNNETAPGFAQTLPNTRAGGFRNGPEIEPILPPDEPMKQPEPVEVVDLLSFDDFDSPAPAVAAPYMETAPTQTERAPSLTQAHHHATVQVQAQDSYSFAQAPAQDSYAFGQAPAQTNCTPARQTYAPSSNPFLSTQVQDQNETKCISPVASPGQSGNNHMTFDQDVSTFSPSGASGNHIETGNVAPKSSLYAPQPNPVTPQESSTALVPVQAAPVKYGIDGGMKNLVNIDDLFGSAAAPITKESIDAKMEGVNAHKSLGQLHGSNGSNSRDAKSPVMNPFNSGPVYDQHGVYNGCAAQQPQQQQQHSNYNYQPSYGQSWAGYQ